MASKYPPDVAGRFVTKANTSGQDVWTVGLTTVGAGYSSWGQLTASVSADSVITSVVGYHSTNTTLSTATLQLGTGGAGAEAALLTLMGVVDQYNASSVSRAVSFPGLVGARVSAGTRLSARLNFNVSSGTFTVIVAYVPVASLEGN